MRNTIWGLVVAVVIVTGLLAACAPAASQPEPPKAQPTTSQAEPPKAQPTAPQAEPPKAQPTVAAAPAGDGAALLNDRCTVCHNLDRVKSAKKTSEQWAQTVSRMVGKGAKLNADEQKAVVAYLAKTYAP
jgi:cytochrome c5